MSTAASTEPRHLGTRRIARSRLVHSLQAAGDKSVVVLDAPAGYGKTLLLAEWRATADGRRFAGLSLDPGDSDPARLLRRLAAAIPGPGRIFGGTTGALLDGLAAQPEPLVVVLDDYHRLRGSQVQDLLGEVVAGLPATIQLVVATRADPALPLARLRARGELLELRADDLRFDGDEAQELLQAYGLALDPGVVTELVKRTEGWPAGLYLAARALRTEPDPAAFASRFAGTHRHVADLLAEEVLRYQSRATRTFLLQTSILERLAGPLCDAVLGSSGSQAMLHGLERSNSFVVALDHERAWFRYHRLFRDMLLATLARTEPDLVPELHHRASAWFDAAGLHDFAADHALAAVRLTSSRSARRDSPWRANGPGDAASGALEYGQQLTERELTILHLLPTRLSQREIARELYVSVNTVKTHSRAIYRKLGVTCRREATDQARLLGLLEPVAMVS